MHNTGTVMRFEVLRSLKKRSFWIAALIFPIGICLIFLIITFSNRASDDAAKSAQNQRFSIEVTDESGLVTPSVLSGIGARTVADQATGIADVRSDRVDAYFYYPADLGAHSVKIYAKDVGLFDDGRYEAVAKSLVESGASAHVDPNIKAVLDGSVNFETSTFSGGQPAEGFKKVILPGVFLILFYILIVVFGNRMLVSATEEKENRVIEMLLTSVSARAIIVGKIIALLALGLIQVLVIVVPVTIVYILFRHALSLPDLDLSNLPVDPWRIIAGAALFITGFTMFTGLLVAIGASVPTAKEAGGFFGGVMLLLFGPLYAVTLFVSAPDSGVVTFLSFFPLTAPIPLLLRNAVGNLSVAQTLLGIGVLAISGLLVLIAAVRLYRYGALQFSGRVPLRTLLRK